MIFYLNGMGQSDPSSTLDDSYSFLLGFIKKELFLQLLIISDFLGFGKTVYLLNQAFILRKPQSITTMLAVRLTDTTR